MAFSWPPILGSFATAFICRYSPCHVLTGRELEIVVLTAPGMATSDLTRALGLTGSTAKWYWQRIFAKLEVHRRFEVIKVARHRGWIA